MTPPTNAQVVSVDNDPIRDGSCNRPELSVVIGVLDEAPNVPEVCRRLHSVLQGCTSSYEILFVDDGSRDGTSDAVLLERAKDARVKLLSFSRNFGHQNALTAGLEAATGEAVITMDGDLQHPPELIPALVERWREGFEVVKAIRLTTANAGLAKRVLSKGFYAALNHLCDINLEDGAADFRLLGRAAVDALRNMPERSRFVRGMVQWIGFRQTTVHYHANARWAGTSKYSLARQFRFAVVGVLAFSTMPLYFVVLLGLLMAAVSVLYGVYAVVAHVAFDATLPGWASILAGLMFIGGVQLLALGIAGAYIAKIYEETKARPLYIIREAHGVAALEAPFQTAERLRLHQLVRISERATR